MITETTRQHDIEALASELLDERPQLSTADAVRLASSVIDQLDELERDWDLRSALAWALQQPLARTA